MGKIIDIKQNTPEWHEFRKDKIGASDAPAIMGVSPWCTPWQLYMRKLGLIPDQPDNAAMANGRYREAEELTAFNKQYGCNCVPVVMQHSFYGWMIASLDGWDEEKKIAVEIKCTGKEDHECAEIFRMVPEHYMPQCQHQMEVLGIDKMHYWDWHKGIGKSVEVVKSESYIHDMINKELDFIMRLTEMNPPELSVRDYAINNSEEWRLSAQAYKYACQRYKNAEVDKEHHRNQLIKLAEDRNCAGNGVKVSKSVRRGQVEYTRIISELLGDKVDMEPYRKEPIIAWRINEE